MDTIPPDPSASPGESDDYKSQQLNRRQFLQLIGGAVLTPIPLIGFLPNIVNAGRRPFNAQQPPDGDGWLLPSDPYFGSQYGRWLGTMYLTERNLSTHHPEKPWRTYILVDFDFCRKGSWIDFKNTDLRKFDKEVYEELLNIERTRLVRPDILDSDLDHVYEIKPAGLATEGRKDIDFYLQRLDNVHSTSPLLGEFRLRNWQGGDWDPSPYRLILSSTATDSVTIVEARKDKFKKGLILYEIKRRRRTPEEEEAFVDTHVTVVTNQLESFRPTFETTLKEQLPKAPVGSTYAFIVPERFYQLFVPEDRNKIILEKLAAEADRPLIERIIEGLALDPLRGMVAEDIYLTKYMSLEEQRQLAEFELKYWLPITLGVVGVALVAYFAGPAILAALAEGASVATVSTQVAQAASIFRIAQTTVGVARAAPAALGIARSIPSSHLVDGVGTGIATVFGPSLTGAVAKTISSNEFRAGVGFVGALVVGALSSEALASSEPTSDPGQVLGVEACYLFPTGFITPKRGKIDVGEPVNFGSDTYRIVALVVARGS